jgi:hypothetical protein
MLFDAICSAVPPLAEQGDPWSIRTISEHHSSREIIRSFPLFTRTTKSFNPSARTNVTGCPSNSFGKKTSDIMSPDPIRKTEIVAREAILRDTVARL